jgi:ATP-dependent Clp protease adaptor protein ClpS
MAGAERRDDPARGEVVTEGRVRPKKPKMYRVVLLNDDYTPMEFVVWVLQTVFRKPQDEAMRLMLQVHHRGKGICGVFTFDVARTKARQVMDLARRHDHPLQCELEVVETE